MMPTLRFEEYKDSVLNSSALSDLCVIKGRIGYRGYTTEDIVKRGDGAIALSPSNIDGKLVYNDDTYISWDKYNESPEIMVKVGDIIFVKTRGEINC